MRKYIFFLILTVVLLASCKQKNNYTIEGEIRGAKNGTLYLFSQDRDKILKIDSVDMKKGGKFDFSGHITEPKLYYLNFGSSVNQVNFFIEPGTIIIDAQVDSLNFAKIQGGPTQELYNEFNTYLTHFANNTRDLYLHILTAAAQKSDSLDYYQNKWTKLKSREQQFIAQFSFSHTDNEISPFIAFNYIGSAKPKLLDTIYHTMSPKVSESYYGKELKKLLHNIRLSEVGNPAPEFSVKKDSIEITNKTYAGRALYIIVWQPEGEDNVNTLTRLKEIYSELEKNGVQVLSSCITNDNELYQEISSYANFPWTDILDAPGAYNELTHKFALSYLPASILISPDGEILARGASPDEILTILNKK